MTQLTQILESVERGTENSATRLLPFVYDELRQLAVARLAREPSGHTLQPTALVHEAWLRLVGADHPSWQNRAHFFAAAAEAMRRILIDHARRRARLKRGGNQERLNLDQVDLAAEAPPEVLLLVDEALQCLAREHPENAELVKLRFYVGLSFQEIAQAWGKSEKTVQRHWVHARAWLFREIQRLMSDANCSSGESGANQAT